MKNGERAFRLLGIYFVISMIIWLYKNDLHKSQNTHLGAAILIGLLFAQFLIEVMGWIGAALGAKDRD